MAKSSKSTLKNILGSYFYKFKRLISILIDKPLTWILKTSVKHIYGPKKVDYAKDELVVLCLVRNGELYMKSFIEHYFSLGVKHIVFLDNNSTDETISIAKNYKNVTILQTKLPFRNYSLVMMRYLLHRFARNRWGLIVDIDELFDYPFSDKLDLKSFLTYLNNKSYTTVVTQMLDMFSDKPLSSLESKKEDSIKEKYSFYDISSLIKGDYKIYPNHNVVSNKDIKAYFGGIRNTIFGYKGWLTKHALIFMDDKISPLTVSTHMVKGARVADLSAVLLHYKFLGNFVDYVSAVVKEKLHHKAGLLYYLDYYSVLKGNPDLIIKQKTSLKFENMKNLIDNNFLAVSKDYIDWVWKQGKNNER
jgi:hypothetical protein